MDFREYMYVEVGKQYCFLSWTILNCKYKHFDDKLRVQGKRIQITKVMHVSSLFQYLGRFCTMLQPFSGTSSELLS